MRKRAFKPCIPTASKKSPDGPDWIHEIKHDGCRLLVHRDHDQVRLITRDGHDWTKKHPWIVDGALHSRASTAPPAWTTCTARSTMTKCSFTPSTCWR